MRIPVLPFSLLALLTSVPLSWTLPNEIKEPRERLNELKHGLPKPPTPPNPPPLPPPRPLVIWHGLGDQYMSTGMVEFIELIKEMHEGIFVYSVRISDEPSTDQKAGWFGNVNKQLEQVADQISSIDELQGGFDAIGFSQGGQFLRGYVERYNSPPVRNLITFGSQHMGIADLPGCKPTDFLCKAAKSGARAGVYTPWAQNNLVQAQYFRDHTHYASYLASHSFLADINNEINPEDEAAGIVSRNTTYAENFASLDNLVMALFDQDKTVIPKESSWFGSYALPDDDDDDATTNKDKVNGLSDESPIVHMRKQPLYKEDWIGLRALDEADKVFLVVCEGVHMHLADECWRPIVRRWVGNIDIDVDLPSPTKGTVERLDLGPQRPQRGREGPTRPIPPLLLQDW